MYVKIATPNKLSQLQFFPFCPYETGSPIHNIRGWLVEVKTVHKVSQPPLLPAPELILGPHPRGLGLRGSAEQLPPPADAQDLDLLGGADAVLL